MKINSKYIKFCKKYQKLLRKIFRHKWQTGQVWIASLDKDNPHIYDKRMYKLIFNRDCLETFGYLEGIVIYFRDFEKEGEVLWLPTILDMQKLLYNKGKFLLTDKERDVDSLLEAIRITLKYIAFLSQDEDEKNEIIKAIEDSEIFEE